MIRILYVLFLFLLVKNILCLILQKKTFNTMNVYIAKVWLENKLILNINILTKKSELNY